MGKFLNLFNKKSEDEILKEMQSDREMKLQLEDELKKSIDLRKHRESIYIKSINELIIKESDVQNLMNKKINEVKQNEEELEENIEENLQNNDLLNDKEKENIIDEFKKIFSFSKKEEKVLLLIDEKVIKKDLTNTDIVKGLNDAIKSKIATINSPIMLRKFFKVPIIRYILYNKIFSKFEKTFIEETVINKIKIQLFNCKFKLAPIRFGKKLGQEIRKKLFDIDNPVSCLAIFGPACRKGSKNLKNIINKISEIIKNCKNKIQKDIDDNVESFTNKFKSGKNLIDILEENYSEKNAALISLALVKSQNFKNQLLTKLNEIISIINTAGLNFKNLKLIDPQEGNVNEYYKKLIEGCTLNE